MHRFYCPHLSSADVAHLPGSLVSLDADESHHAARVLRITSGQAVGLFDGRGLGARGVVESVHKSVVTVRVETAVQEPPVRPQVWIAAAVAKGGRPDDMVDQLSQVNAAGWLPLLSARSVVDPRTGKIDKLRRCAIAAAKQCGRHHLLQIADPVSLGQALVQPADLRLWASTHSDDHLEPSLPAKLAGSERVMVYIGPEGGWTAGEEEQATAAGAIRWSLGSSIMRIETAAVAAAAIALYISRMHP